jgi:hypothetical protein
MENERWGWFAGGVVLGILIGLGVAVGFILPRYHAARAEAEQAREEAMMQADRAHELELRTRMVAEQAAREAERERQRAEDALRLLKQDKQAEKEP